MIEIVRHPKVNEGKPVYRAYGQLWPSVPIIKDGRAARLAIELEAFRVGLTAEQGGKGRFGHYRTVCEWLFPTFEWNRWAIKVGKALCENDYVGVTGCASSNKSGSFTVFGLVSYLSDPENMLIFVLTTSVKDAETRIWADFNNRFNEMRDGGIDMFKIVGREHYIGFKDTSKGKGRASSISLVAAADEFREDAVKKLQGAKNENVIVLLDEGQDCQPRGTKVMTPNGCYKNIEDIKEGEFVVTHSRSCIYPSGRKVNRVSKKFHSGNIVKIETQSGLSSRYTPEHICIVKIGEAFSGKTLLYLMKKGNSFRIGTSCKSHGKRPGKVCGPVGRMREEGGESVWILGAFDNKNDALMAEAWTSIKFGIPEVMFKDGDRPGGAGQKRIDKFWSDMGDLTRKAHACLRYYGRELNHPFASRSNSEAGSRKGYVLMCRGMEMRACNIMDGMSVLDVRTIFIEKPYTNKLGSEFWTPISVKLEKFSDYVWSLDVDEHHTYVADGIVTHNCAIGVMDACLNLRNNPHFEFKCAGNASEPFDAHGTFCCPVDGWNSISDDAKDWEIEVNGKRGVCIHLDGLDSPNFDRYEELGNKNAYTYLKRVEEVQADQKGLGDKNPAFWRQCRGFWPPQGIEVEIIFPQADFQKYEATSNVTWVYQPTEILSVDPSYTSGGDRFIVTHMKYGQTERPLPTVHREKTYDLKIEGSTENSSISLNMVRKVRALAEELNIPPYNVGVDGGSGDLIVHAFHDHWSREIMAVHFGGSPSELIYCKRDPRPCKDVFDRKASELWYVMREFLINGQISGLDRETCREMSIRKYEMRNRKIRIESKADMKSRTNGVSPDLGDSLAIGFSLLRERFKLVAGKEGKQESEWQRIFGTQKKVVDKPKGYVFKSLSTMQAKSQPKQGQKSSIDAMLGQMRR